MNADLLAQLLPAVRDLARGLSARRGEAFHETECDVLCALCVLFPDTHLSSMVASVDNRDTHGNAVPGDLGVETFTLRQAGVNLDLSGPISETVWRDKAIAALVEFLDKHQRPCDRTRVRVEMFPHVPIDHDDPDIIEALDLIAPCYLSAMQARQLEEDTDQEGGADDFHRRL